MPYLCASVATTAAMGKNMLSRRDLLQYTAALCWLVACKRHTPQYSRLPHGSTVLALGDSLTMGYGVSKAQSYPAQLAQITAWQVINGGVTGDTSAQALARLPALMRQSPKLVLVSIGGNDFLRRVPENLTRANISQIIETIQAAHVPVVLVAIPYFTLGALVGSVSEHQLYDDLAQQYRIPLLKGAWAGILGQEKLRSDQIHANAAGYRLFAEKMAAFLQQQGFY